MAAERQSMKNTEERVLIVNKTSEIEIGWRKNYTTTRESKPLKRRGKEEEEANWILRIN
jgi:hypothetical protein